MSELVLFNLEEISYHKDKMIIVDKINMSLKEKELATIIGPNGAGKTTILKLIIGSITPSSGKITKSRKLKIGYVPQKLNLSSFLPLTVKEFLTLNKLPLSQEIINLTQIQHLLDYSFANLSGGELQRVLLARSLGVKPNLLILDEPDQNLDLIGQNDFFQLIEKIQKLFNVAILIVSHNLNMVMANSAKIYCVNKHICCEGEAHSIKNNPRFKEIFGNKLAIYQHKHNHKHS